MPDSPPPDPPRKGDELPQGALSPLPDDSPARDRRAFAWTFGLCAAMPLVGGVALLLGGTLESSSAELGVYLLVLSPVAWALGLLFGIIARASGQRAQGNAMMLGALAGAVVGFSLCSGAALLGGSF